MNRWWGASIGNAGWGCILYEWVHAPISRYFHQEPWSITTSFITALRPMAKKHYCGFCGKSDEEVDRLLAGPCIEVCNECIDMMHQIVHTPKPLPPLKPARADRQRKVISFKEEARKRGRQ